MVQFVWDTTQPGLVPQSLQLQVVSTPDLATLLVESGDSCVVTLQLSG
jgi:hypothetical protein